MTKKFFLAFIASLLTVAFALDVSFSNEFSSDVIHYTSEDNNVDFAGVYNETIVDFTSDFVDGGIDIEFGLDDFYDGDYKNACGLMLTYISIGICQ